MTSVSEARETFYLEFESHWTETPLAQTKFENEEFNPDDFEESARGTLRNLDGGQQTLGAPGLRKYQRFASWFVDIFTPAGRKGMARSGVIAQHALTLFEGKTLQDVNGEDIWTLDGTVRELGSDGGKYHTQIEIDVRYFETK